MSAPEEHDHDTDAEPEELVETKESPKETTKSGGLFGRFKLWGSSNSSNSNSSNTPPPEDIPSNPTDEKAPPLQPQPIEITYTPDWNHYADSPPEIQLLAESKPPFPPVQMAPWGSWTEDDTSKLNLRGPTFLQDKIKIPCSVPLFKLVHVDMFYNTKEKIFNVSTRPDNYAYIRHAQRLKKWREIHGADWMPPNPQDDRSTLLSPMLIINFLFPGPADKHCNLVLYFVRRVRPVNESKHSKKDKKKHQHHAHDHAHAHDNTTPDSPISPLIDLPRVQAFDRVLHQFLDGSDDFRDGRLKIIPRIAEGPWIVKKGVGCVPAILGKKIKQTYYRDLERNFFEINADVGSSVVAGKILALVKSAATSLVIELSFTLQGESEDELPESLIGGVRLYGPNLVQTLNVDENAIKNNPNYNR